MTSYKFIQENREYLFELKKSNLFLLLFVFLIGTILWVFGAGFGSPVALLGGFIFGKWLGTIIVVSGLTIGSTLLYIFANFFFRDLIKSYFSKKFGNLKDKFKKNELNFFLLYRFIGGIPFQIANLLPVIFNVSIKNYLVGTFLGIMPQLFIYVSLGSGIEKIINQNILAPSLLDLFFSKEIYIPIIGFLFLLLFTIIIRRKIYKK